MEPVSPARERIARAMLRGGKVQDVNDEIIEPLELSSEHKAALWLYAWSFMHPLQQRREALSQLAQLSEH